MKKLFRSAIAIILAISMMPLCFAIEPESQGGTEWAALDDDTVVCYLYGKPVHKSDVSEGGIIDVDAVLSPGDIQLYNYTGYYVEQPIDTQYRKNNILTGSGMYTVHGTIQREVYSYYKNNNAQTRINELQDGINGTIGDSIISIADAVIGLIPSLPAEVYALYYTAVLLDAINDVALMEAISNIRSVVNQSKDVLVITINSNYGKFIAVHEWDGVNCICGVKSVSGVESQAFYGLVTKYALSKHAPTIKVW